MAQAPIRISRRWFTINLVGAALTGCGVWLQQQTQVPPLVGTLLLAVGVPLMMVSVFNILRRAMPPR